MSYAGEGEGEGDGAGSGAAGRTAFRVAEKRFKLVKEDTGQRRRRRGQQRGQGSDAAAGEGGSAEGALAGAVDFRALEQRFLATGHLADTAAPAATAAAGASGGAGSATAGGDGAACVAAVAVSSIVREEGAAGLPCPVYTVQGRPGFFFLPGALTVQQQAQLIQEAVQGSVEPPNRTNHTAALGAIHGLWPAFALSCAAASDQGSTEHGGGDDGGGGGGGGSSSRRRVSAVLRPCVGGGEAEGVQCAGKRGMGGEASEWGGENGWRGIAGEGRCVGGEAVGGGRERGVNAEWLVGKLRWATLGVQFDWSTRAYDPSLPFRPFPTFLAHLASRLAAPAMPSAHATFSPEAAIVNFYHPGDMLGGHVDDMEADWTKPIVSISLGCKAVFLLGGRTRDEAPMAVVVRSGDVLLMAGPCRECFHGIPRIYSDPHEADIPAELLAPLSAGGLLPAPMRALLPTLRININVRQVY
ncbi:unnamed protein product [Closterium sp. NIES-65]|nr:unnamed protein product [Closterium sp. NIES-65]